MSRKILKELRKALPNLSPEQVDAFDKFYANTPNDAYKTFASEEDFKEYEKSLIDKTTKPLQNKLQELELKPKLEEAKKAYIEAGNKESMWKYIESKMYEEKDGQRTFVEASLKKDYWIKTISTLDDKENYASSSAQTISTPPIGRQHETNGENKQTNNESRNIYF